MRLLLLSKVNNYLKLSSTITINLARLILYPWLVLLMIYL